MISLLQLSAYPLNIKSSVKLTGRFNVKGIKLIEYVFDNDLCKYVFSNDIVDGIIINLSRNNPELAIKIIKKDQFDLYYLLNRISGISFQVSKCLIDMGIKLNIRDFNQRNLLEVEEYYRKKYPCHIKKNYINRIECQIQLNFQGY